MNEQGYQFLECDKNYKESDDSDVLMTILMVMVMMMVVMLIIIVKPKQQGSTHYQKSTADIQYSYMYTAIHITRALAAGSQPAAPCFLWSCRLKEQYPVTAHAPNLIFGQDVAKSKDARRVREP